MYLCMNNMEMKVLPTLFIDIVVENSDVYKYPSGHADNVSVVGNQKPNYLNSSLGQLLWQYEIIYLLI